MKYIRTKDGRILCVDREQYHYFETKIGIVKQADTIEELCDEFVINNEVIVGSPRDGMNRLQLAAYYAKNGKNVFGAIWTEWGLKYVAKLNDEKGELELL